MGQLSREECIELGLSIPTPPLVGWAVEQFAAVTGREAKLESRGITAPYLKELMTLIEAVAELQLKLGKKKSALPPELAETERIRGAALAYWREVQQILKIEFGACADIQVRCRTGVHTGGLISNLRRELECLVAVLREFTSQLSWLGVDQAFIGTGEVLIGKLREAQGRLDAACTSLSPDLLELSRRKGQLYDLSRKLVRIGKLAFLQEPEQAAVFNYTLLRKELRPGSEVRVKRVKTVVR